MMEQFIYGTSVCELAQPGIQTAFCLPLFEMTFSLLFPLWMTQKLV